jgi:hypothetical protein
MMKSAQHRFLSNSDAIRQSVSPTGWGKESIAAVWNSGSERRMRTSLIVMANPLAQQSAQVPFTERDQIVKAFPPDCAYQPLAVGVGLWGAHWRSQHSQSERPYLPI